MSAWYSLLWAASLKSVAVLGAAWLAALLLRGRSAAARRLVWSSALAALLAVPFLSVSLPRLGVPVAAVLPAPNVIFQTTVTAPADAPGPAHPARLASLPAAIPAPWRPDWRSALLLLWAAGAAVALAQMLVAWAAMWRVRRAARPFAAPELDELKALLGMRHELRVLETRRGSMPMTFGLLRPAIFVPADAAGWSEERRRLVLLHELAHVRSGDAAVHLLARFALSLYWWNPLAWAAWRRLLKERERAADDLVLAAGARPSDYAGHLLEIARAMQSPPAIGWAAVAMAWRSQLEGRLMGILDARVNRSAPGRAATVLAAVLAVAVVLPLAALQDNSPQAVPPDVDATIRAAASQKNHEMLENAAQAAIAARQYDTAQKLLESSLALRAETSGTQSVEYGLGLLKLADLESRRRRGSEADAFYRKAVSVLGDRPEACQALIHLGAVAFGKWDFGPAIDYFQRAQLADPSKAGQSAMWMALVRQRQGDAAAADSEFQRALALQGPDTLAAATTMDLYAVFLFTQGRDAESKAMNARAAATRSLASPSIYRVGGAAVAPGKAAQSAGSGVYRVGGGVSAPVLLYKVEPEYSEEARAAKYQGWAVLYVEVGPDGRARNVAVQRSLGFGLDEKALEAVRQWVFKPGMRDGQPVTVAATIEVNFRLM